MLSNGIYTSKIRYKALFVQILLSNVTMTLCLLITPSYIMTSTGWSDDQVAFWRQAILWTCVVQTSIGQSVDHPSNLTVKHEMLR